MYYYTFKDITVQLIFSKVNKGLRNLLVLVKKMLKIHIKVRLWTFSNWDEVNIILVVIKIPGNRSYFVKLSSAVNICLENWVIGPTDKLAPYNEFLVIHEKLLKWPQSTCVCTQESQILKSMRFFVQR